MPHSQSQPKLTKKEGPRNLLTTIRPLEGIPGKSFVYVLGSKIIPQKITDIPQEITNTSVQPIFIDLSYEGTKSAITGKSHIGIWVSNLQYTKFSFSIHLLIQW